MRRMGWRWEKEEAGAGKGDMEVRWRNCKKERKEQKGIEEGWESETRRSKEKIRAESKSRLEIRQADQSNPI